MIENWKLFFKTYNKENLILQIKKHPEDFEKLIELAISNSDFSWRATWLLWSCMEENDIRIKKFTNKFVEILPNRDGNQQREIIIILEKMQLQEQEEGRLFDTCILIWENTKNTPSLRYHAFKMILKIVEKYNDLQKEISFLIEPQYTETLSPGVQQTILKMYKNLNK